MNLPAPSSIKIKNCGLKTLEAIAQAAATGASFAGFVHHSASPRHLDLTEMAALVQYARPRMKTVAVLVNPDFDVLYDVGELVQPDYIQLHGVLDAAKIHHIATTIGIPVITALAAQDASELAYARELEGVSSHLLFDAKHPGGGKSFDWSVLQSLILAKPWFLAGGLTPLNVAEAARITQAPMVDVSSGIEDAPGHKSLEKIAAFNAAVLGSR